MVGTKLTGLSLAAALAVLTGMAAAEPRCSAVWSISNSYTVASDTTSFETLNIYLTNPGSTEITAPYNLTISNPAYVAAHSWNFQVQDVSDGVITGITQPANAFWQTILPGSRNTVNLGGNIETTEVAASPQSIVVDGIECTLEEKLEGLKYGGPGELRPPYHPTPAPTPAYGHYHATHAPRGSHTPRRARHPRKASHGEPNGRH